MKVLYAGDSPVGGPANYLLGILRYLKADFLHLTPSEILEPKLLKKQFNVIILSDFSRKQVPDAAQRLITEQVLSGTGLLMVGGWGSFSGPFGGWQKSMLEKLLPVECLDRDDRLNFPQGAIMELACRHPMLKTIPFNYPPAICGMNLVRPKKTGEILLSARKITAQGINRPGKLSIRSSTECYPLLVISGDSRMRTAAFASDFAPHWCGGFVDWGNKTLRLPVTRNIRVEAGNYYVLFITRLLNWLAGAA